MNAFLNRKMFQSCYLLCLNHGNGIFNWLWLSWLIFFPWNYSFCGNNIRNNVQKMMLIEYVSSNSVAYEKVQTNRKLFRWCGSCYGSPVLKKKPSNWLVLFHFISFSSFEFMCFIHFHLQFSCTGIDENYEFSNARQIVRKWEKSRMLLPISQLVLHVISKWRRLRIKIDNKNVSFYKLCDLFRRLVVIRTQRSYGDNLFVQSIYIFKKRWYKKKLNKCLPQHIKLNIYLHLKRAEKKVAKHWTR